MKRIRVLSMLFTLFGGVMLFNPAEGLAMPPFCGLCYDYCPGQWHADNACLGVGCTTSADFCTYSPLCANEWDILIVCEGEPE